MVRRRSVLVGPVVELPETCGASLRYNPSRGLMVRNKVDHEAHSDNREVEGTNPTGPYNHMGGGECHVIHAELTACTLHWGTAL